MYIYMTLKESNIFAHDFGIKKENNFQNFHQLKSYFENYRVKESGKTPDNLKKNILI